jgi:hypothetical protein
MPPVIDTPNYDHVEAHTLDRERPQARGARPGFWRSLHPDVFPVTVLPHK